MAPVLLPLIGAAVGSAAIYWFDPEHGRRRRVLIRDQAVKAACNVRSVEPRAGGQTHWVVARPADTEVQWDSVITQFIPNEVIAWRTVKGSPIGT